MPDVDLQRLNRKWNCKLTTIGRKSGAPRTVVLWFALEDGWAYLAGGKQNPQWCRNVRADGAVTLEIAGHTLRGTAKVVEDPAEGQAVIGRILKKYVLARLSRPFGGYTNSVPVAIDLK